MVGKPSPLPAFAARSAKFPCIFPLNRELARREPFAPDWQHSHALSNLYGTIIILTGSLIFPWNPPYFTLANRFGKHRDAFAPKPAPSGRESLSGGIWGSTFCVGGSSKRTLRGAQRRVVGIVRANSFTLPKRQNRISRPLIFLHFSGSI